MNATMLYKAILIFSFTLVSFGSSFNGRVSPVATFGSMPERLMVRAGQSVRLSCPVYNLGPRTVVWRRTGSDYIISAGSMVWVRNGGRLTVDVHGEGETQNFDLVFDSVSASDSGAYYCQITARHYLRSPETQLIVRDEATVEIRDPGEVTEGFVLDLECMSTTGYPGPLRWKKDGSYVEADQEAGIEIDQSADSTSRSISSKLTIGSVQESDAGNYTCEATVGDEIFEGQMEVTVQQMQDSGIFDDLYTGRGRDRPSGS